jgi:very-short-patch-repair endonuclease
MSPPEIVLWSHLRRGQLGGLRFRRQHPLGPYVADFYCHESRLVVEIDSTYHGGNLDYDDARDDWMRGRGLRVLRFTSSDVAKNKEGVLELILRVGRRDTPSVKLEDSFDTSPARAGEDAEPPAADDAEET